MIITIITDFVKDKVVCIKFKGNGFLHNMIRIIVAMLIEVGNNRLEIENLKMIMEAKNRKLAPKTAPANGLYLYEITYFD